MDEQQNITIYRTADGRASVALYAKDGKIWLNQQQMADLFATSKQTISYHIINILKENELSESSVVKEYLTTAADGKNYNECTAEPTRCVHKHLCKLPLWHGPLVDSSTMECSDCCKILGMMMVAEGL